MLIKTAEFVVFYLMHIKGGHGQCGGVGVVTNISYTHFLKNGEITTFSFYLAISFYAAVKNS